MPTAMDDYNAWKDRNEKIEQALVKQNRTAGTIAAIASFAGGFIKPGSGNVVAQGAQQGMSALQEQQEMDRARRRSDFEMEQKMKQLDFQQRVAEFGFAQDKIEADRKAKAMDLGRKDAEFRIEQSRKEKEWALKYTTQERKGFVDFLKKAGDVPVLGGVLKKPAEKLAIKTEEAIPEAEKIQKQLPMQEDMLRTAAQVSPEAVTATGQSLGMLTPTEQASAQAQAEKDERAAMIEILDLRKKSAEVMGLEANEEALGSFWGVLDGTVDTNTLPRPVKARVLGMLQAHLEKLQDRQMDQAKDAANIRQSNASAASSYASANKYKTETLKTQVEIQKLIEQPQGQLTFDEIKEMPQNVREQYYYNPIRSFAATDDVDGILGKLGQMKDEGMQPQDMTKFLQSLVAESSTPRSYDSFESDLKKQLGLIGISPKPEEVAKYIKRLGFTKTVGGDYIITAPFFMNLRDPDNIQQILADIYGSQPYGSQPTSITYEMLTGNTAGNYYDSLMKK